MSDPFFAASEKMHDMAGETGNKKLGYALTGLSVFLIAVMAVKELKGLFRDEFKEWEGHRQRHESHAEKARQSHGHEGYRGR